MTRFVYTLLAFAGPAWSVSADEDHRVVAEIEADFRSRREGPSAVEYAVSGKIIYPAGGLTNPDDKQAAPQVRAYFPPVTESAEISATLLFDVRNGRVKRHDSEFLLHVSLGKFIHRDEQQAFNGRSTYQKYVRGQEGIPDPGYKHGDQVVKHQGISIGFLTLEDCPLLFAHGYVGNSNPILLDLSKPAFFSARHWMSTGPGLIDGDNCVVLRSITSPTKYEEMWIDRSRKSAVRRWKLVNKGKVQCQFDIAYDKVDSYWLPKSWKYDDMDGRGPIPNRVSRQMAVRSVVVDPQVRDSDFELSVETGTLVRDPNDSTKDMVVDRDGQLIPRSSFRKYGWKFWATTVLSLAVIFLAVWSWRSRTRPTSGTQ